MKSCGACLYSKGNEQYIPPQTDTVVRFAPEHVARLFLIIGGGGTMTKFEKIYLMILILDLLVQIIDLFK